jgi:hypothetical protein
MSRRVFFTSDVSKEAAAHVSTMRSFIAPNYPAEMRVPNPETDLSNEQIES